MDAITVAALEPVEVMPADCVDEQKRPKRESGYTRMKKWRAKEQARADALTKDLTALEALVQRLLNHLEVATSSDLTAQQRRGYLNLVADVRRNLA